METGVTGFRTELNISPMLFYNSLDSVEAETGTFANSFGCEKRLEDMGLYLVGNSWTVIANLNHSATVVAIGSDAKFPFSVHGVNGIINNVGPDLVELASKRIH